MAVETVTSKGTRDRSPAYPFIGLRDALERLRQFHKIERKNAAYVHVAVSHWGYKQKSSGGIQTIAALKAFGLLHDIGGGKERKVQLSDLGLRIVQDERPESPERDQLIKKAALMPKIHATLWNKYHAEPPSSDNLKHELKVDFGFNPNVVDDFIKEYRDTISYARLGESDTVSPEATNGGAGKDTSAIKVGDYVQWEPNGVLQFADPKPITSLSSDELFAFVEGSSTGLPVGELTLQRKTPNHSSISSVIPALQKSKMRQDIFSLSEGTVTIQWPTPLSAESIQDLKDWLTIVERKISRSVASPDEVKESPN
jgi:hypothetical protein